MGITHGSWWGCDFMLEDWGDHVGDVEFEQGKWQGQWQGCAGTWQEQQETR
jgi:hypothetical protein